MNLTKMTRHILALTCFLGTVGCDADDQITTYQAPKDQPVAPLRPLAPQASAPVTEATSTPLTWTVPDGWKAVEGNSMSAAAFQVSDANPAVKCIITPLPMIENALLANVNRWEGQLGLAPTEKENIQQVAKPVKVGEMIVHMVDLSNDQNAILGAIIEKEQIWFIKLAGPKETVSPQKEKFDAFIKSLKFTDQPQPQPQAEVPGNDPHAGHNHAGITWTLPANWTEAPNTSSMRLATIKAGDAEMAASQLAAQGWGNLLDNINRWRGQIGMEPIDDASKQPATNSEANGVKWTTYDFPGPQKRMIVSFATVGESVYFFRLAGASDAVEAQKAAFEEFVKSVKFQ